jgi:hypothetical protein
MHGGNIQEQMCSYNEWGRKCTNRARHGGVCYDHYIEQAARGGAAGAFFCEGGAGAFGLKRL